MFNVLKKIGVIATKYANCNGLYFHYFFHFSDHLRVTACMR